MREHQQTLEEELVVTASWGVSKTKRDRRDVQEAKLNLQGDRMLETPEKLLVVDARSERANSQHVVENILVRKVFILENSSELKWRTCIGGSAAIFFTM